MNLANDFQPDRSHLPGVSGPGFEIRVDAGKNRLYLSLGELDLESARAVVLGLGRWVWTLSPGFTMINDLTRYQPVNQKVALHITRGQTVLLKAGMGKGARVSASPLADLQFSRRGKQVGLDVETVRTLAEARALLERWERDNRPAQPRDEA